MLIYKEIHTTLNLSDPDDIYHPDVVDLCTRKLTERYVNRNYKSCHIVSIEKIINVSARKADFTLGGSVSIDVHFQVKGVQLSRNDILHGCEVVKITSRTDLIAKTVFAGVNVKCVDTGIYKVGDVIPVVVKMVAYLVGRDNISVTALQFSPIFPDPIYYKITDPITDADVKISTFLLDRIAELEIVKFTADEKKVYLFFQSLIFPYKKETKFPKFKPLEHVKKLSSGDVVYIPNQMSKHRKGFVMGGKDVDAINISAGNFYSILLIDYLKYIESLHGFVKNYDFNKIKSHKLTWKTFSMLKK